VVAEPVSQTAEFENIHQLNPRGDTVPPLLAVEESLPESSSGLAAPPQAAAPLAALPPEWEAKFNALAEQIRAQKDAEEDLRFQLETLSTVPSYGAPTIPNLPPGLDPTQTVTMADMAQILPNVLTVALRAGFGNTPDVEAEVLKVYPRLQALPEPQRTEAIQKARQRLQARQPAPASAQPSPQPPQAPIVVRPAGPTVSAPEAGGGGSAGTTPEPSAVDRLIALRAEYDAALNERDPRLRKAKMKAAANKWAQAHGRKSYGELLQGSYTQTRS